MGASESVFSPQAMVCVFEESNAPHRLDMPSALTCCQMIACGVTDLIGVLQRLWDRAGHGPVVEIVILLSETEQLSACFDMYDPTEPKVIYVHVMGDGEDMQPPTPPTDGGMLGMTTTKPIRRPGNFADYVKPLLKAVTDGQVAARRLGWDYPSGALGDGGCTDADQACYDASFAINLNPEDN